MKKLIFLGLATFAFTAMAQTSPKGLSAYQAEGAVIKSAHSYIGRSAPDFGGNVHSPCATDLNGDVYTVKCSGVANDTIGGDGSVKESFTCTGSFVQGHDGLFYQTGRVDCK
jgi:hypothetical protein